MPRTPDDRRIGWLERALRRRLLSDQCVGLIALSDYALRQFRAQHAGFDRLPELLAKTERIYPVAPARRTAPKLHSDRLRLLFVGRDFMRKGGPVLLRAHAALRAQGIPVESTVVSSLQWSADDYVGPPDARLRRGGDEGPRGRRGSSTTAACRPAKVYELMDAADYLVFPTFHDTFGFVADRGARRGHAGDRHRHLRAARGGRARAERLAPALRERCRRRQVGLALPPARARLSRGLRGDDATARGRAGRDGSPRRGRTRADYEALSAGALAVHAAPLPSRAGPAAARGALRAPARGVAAARPPSPARRSGAARSSLSEEFQVPAQPHPSPP